MTLAGVFRVVCAPEYELRGEAKGARATAVALDFDCAPQTDTFDAAATEGTPSVFSCSVIHFPQLFQNRQRESSQHRLPIVCRDPMRP